jgi:hypothetical protein
VSTKDRLSASVDAELIAVAHEAVTHGRAESVSAWVNDALRLKADHDRRLAALDEFLSAYEAEHGGPGPACWPGGRPTGRPWCCLMLVLDAGAFVAVDRGDRDVVALVKRERLAGRPPVTCGGVVAQVWRGGNGRQVPLARLLAGVDVVPIDDSLGRRAGILLARSGQSDAIDAAVVCLAGDGDDILTSDPGDLRALAEAAGIHLELVPV